LRGCEDGNCSAEALLAWAGDVEEFLREIQRYPTLTDAQLRHIMEYIIRPAAARVFQPPCVSAPAQSSDDAVGASSDRERVCLRTAAHSVVLSAFASLMRCLGTSAQSAGNYESAMAESLELIASLTEYSFWFRLADRRADRSYLLHVPQLMTAGPKEATRLMKAAQKQSDVAREQLVKGKTSGPNHPLIRLKDTVPGSDRLQQHLSSLLGGEDFTSCSSQLPEGRDGVAWLLAQLLLRMDSAQAVGAVQAVGWQPALRLWLNPRVATALGRGVSLHSGSQLGGSRVTVEADKQSRDSRNKQLVWSDGAVSPVHGVSQLARPDELWPLLKTALSAVLEQPEGPTRLEGVQTLLRPLPSLLTGALELLAGEVLGPELLGHSLSPQQLAQLQAAHMRTCILDQLLPLLRESCPDAASWLLDEALLPAAPAPLSEAAAAFFAEQLLAVGKGAPKWQPSLPSLMSLWRRQPEAFHAAWATRLLDAVVPDSSAAVMSSSLRSPSRAAALHALPLLLTSLTCSPAAAAGLLSPGVWDALERLCEGAAAQPWPATAEGEARPRSAMDALLLGAERIAPSGAAGPGGVSLLLRAVQRAARDAPAAPETSPTLQALATALGALSEDRTAVGTWQRSAPGVAADVAAVVICADTASSRGDHASAAAAVKAAASLTSGLSRPVLHAIAAGTQVVKILCRGASRPGWLQPTVQLMMRLFAEAGGGETAAAAMHILLSDSIMPFVLAEQLLPAELERWTEAVLRAGAAPAFAAPAAAAAAAAAPPAVSLAAQYLSAVLDACARGSDTSAGPPAVQHLAALARVLQRAEAEALRTSAAAQLRPCLPRLLPALGSSSTAVRRYAASVLAVLCDLPPADCATLLTAVNAGPVGEAPRNSGQPWATSGTRFLCAEAGSADAARRPCVHAEDWDAAHAAVQSLAAKAHHAVSGAGAEVTAAAGGLVLTATTLDNLRTIQEAAEQDVPLLLSGDTGAWRTGPCYCTNRLGMRNARPSVPDLLS
jgi:hypothetical protein